MSRFELDQTQITGAAPYSSGQHIHVEVSGPGRVDANKSYLSLPVYASTTGTNDYIDSVVGLIENATLYLNDRAVETTDNVGVLMAAYLGKLKSKDWRNTEGVSRMGMGVKAPSLTLTEAAPNTYVYNDEEEESEDGRKEKFHGTEADAAKYAIPLSYLGFRMKSGQIPCYNRMKWRVSLKLRGDVEALTASAGSPIYSVTTPTLVLHREISEAEQSAFNAALSQGFEIDYLSIQHNAKISTANTAFNWDINLNQRVDSQLMIARPNADISAQTANSINAFSRADLKDVYIQYASGQRLPKSGVHEVKDASAAFEMYSQLKQVKKDLDDYMDKGSDGEVLGCGANINGLAASVDTDFMLAFAPRSRESGVARLVSTLDSGTVAAQRWDSYSLSKAKIFVDSAGHELRN